MHHRDVTPEVMFQISKLWLDIMGAGNWDVDIISKYWEPSITRRWAEKINQGRMEDLRVGSRWTGHSKIEPRWRPGRGDFYVEAYENMSMNRGTAQYNIAQVASRVFSAEVRAFLSACDDGLFDPDQLESSYDELNTLCQKGKQHLKNKWRQEGAKAYEEAIGRVQNFTDYDGYPGMLFHSFLAEAVLGKVAARSPSKHVPRAVRNADNSGEGGPWSKYKRALRDTMITSAEGRLLGPDALVSLVKSATARPYGKPAAASLAVHYRKRNNAVVQAYARLLGH